MKLTHLLLICLISFVFFTYVQCEPDEDEEPQLDGEEEPDENEEGEQSVPHGKHPVLRKVFLSAPSWMHIPFSILGAVAAYFAYHIYG
ncbi:unnamed protein product [Schistosoma spindalis]|nr:unnamed protein product [Schistosoma spindale]